MRYKVLVTLLVLFIPFTAYSENVIKEQFDATGLTDVYNIQSDIFPEFNIESFVENLSSGKGAEPEGIIKRLVSFFFGEFASVFKVSVAVIAVGVIAAVLTSLNEAFSSKGAAQAAELAVYCVFAGILTAGFSAVIYPAEEMTESLCVMLKASVSVLIGMCTMSGGAVSAGFMTGLLISMINVVGEIMNKIVIPLTLCSFSLSVAGNMSSRINISTFTLSMRRLAKWIMLFCMAVYSGFFGLYGIAGASLDSALGKAARFAIGSGIPIVGGVVAESVETVMGTLGAVKGITGAAGITVIVITALSPLIKTAAAMWMLRLCAAVLQPVASGNIVSLTSDVADSIGVVFAAMICVCLLFVGSIGIIIGVGRVV